MESPDDDGDLEVLSGHRRGKHRVLKPSDTTPVSSVMLAEIAAKHFPAGALPAALQNAPPVRPVAHLDPADGLDHRFGRSRSRGGRQCGRQLKRTHLELAARPR